MLKTTFRSQLLALAALVALPLVLAYAYSTYQRIEREAVLANERALGLAQGLAQDAERLIASSGEVVKALAVRPQIRALDPTQCDPLLLAGMHEVLPRFSNLALVNLEGTMICASRARSVNLRVSGQPWFQEVVASRARVISKPFKGTITGRPVVMLAHPIQAADSRLLGVIMTPMDMLDFKPVLTGLAVDSKVSLGLIHRDGTLVWRSSDTAQWIGRNIADRDVIKRLLAQSGGLVHGLGFDGSDRIYAGAPVSGTPWLAYASIPKSEAHAALVADAWRTLLVGLAGLLAAMFVAWRMARTMAAPVQALGEAARAAAGGNYAVRVAGTGPLEVTEAAAQFNRMLEERGQQERRVELSEERFRTLAEMSADWFWEQDTDLRFVSTDAYQKGRRLRATPEDHLIGKHRWDLPIISMTEKDWDAHRAVLARREPFHDLIYQAYNGSGRLGWVSTSGEPIFDSQGTFLGYRGIGRDITQSREAERSLRESEARFRAIFEACPLPMSLTRERDGLRIDVNHAWEINFGYSQAESVGANIERIGTYVNLADRARLREMLHATGEVNALEYPARRKDGTVLTAQTWVRRLLIAEESCLLLITRDVTQERENQRQIRELNETLEQRVVERTNELAGANQELEAFAYSVSHDLRAPLRGIDGYSQVLLETHGDRLDEDGRRSLDRIRRGTQRMGHLIDDLLNLAKVTRAPLKRSAVDISALAVEVRDELARCAPERKVEWQIEPGITVMADSGLMRVVLDNLIGNAWKYSRNNPAARIVIEAAQARPAGFEFAVHDNGAGFDMAYIERLFRPFQRLHATAQFEGSGIGLATVQRILVRHGGRIEAISAPGVETVFRVATLSAQLY